MTLSLLKSYVLSHHDLIDWIKGYCERNKIDLVEAYHIYRDGTKGKYFYLTFKSAHQANCFLNRGMKTYPYFEFY
jgi:hypothetical protein